MAVQEFVVLKGGRCSPRKKKSAILAHMAKMRLNSDCVHDHTGYRTPFPSWLSQQKHRMQRRFEYEQLNPPSSNLYRIKYVEDMLEGDTPD